MKIGKNLLAQLLQGPEKKSVTSVLFATPSIEMSEFQRFNNHKKVKRTSVESLFRNSLLENRSLLHLKAIDSVQSLPFRFRRHTNSMLNSLQSTRINLNDDREISFAQSTSREEYKKTVDYDEERWVIRDKVYKDLEVDISRHPSYTIKNIAYNQECEFLYMEAKLKYDAQFLREIKHFISLKPKVIDQFFTRSFLSYTTHWPPLHTKKELEIFIKKFFQLTPKQKNRLNYLMKTDLSLGS